MTNKEKPALLVNALQKTFGAIKASDHIDLELRTGEIHALIGPNGAGKSTLIAQICGEHLPDSGDIHLGDVDITRLSVYARARLGLGRSFQISELCADYTALENVILALVLGSKGAFSCWSNPRLEAKLSEEAQEWLKRVGLVKHGNVRVSNLAHGEKRQLELAVLLASVPQILLLDEPMAGMGAEESFKMAELLKSMKGAYSILLIEHDMDIVFALADRITVLVYGKTIFTGTPEEVREHKGVRAAYLG